MERQYIVFDRLEIVKMNQINQSGDTDSNSCEANDSVSMLPLLSTTFFSSSLLYSLDEIRIALFEVIPFK